MIQTLIPAYRTPSGTQPLSSASIASREANPTVIEPTRVQDSRVLHAKGIQESVPSESDSPVYDDPRKQAQKANQNADERNRELAEQLEVQTLSARDREVRAHERAHAAVGGHYASAPTYQYERGPDGINYAVAGEVNISSGPVSGDPQATIEKAQVVRRAALAPAEPSAQDRQVAAAATKMEMEALAELSVLQQEERVESTNEANNQLDNNKDTSIKHSTSERESENEQPIQNLTDIGLANKQLSESLNQRIMSNGILQNLSAGQLINQTA